MCIVDSVPMTVPQDSSLLPILYVKVSESERIPRTTEDAKKFLGEERKEGTGFLRGRE